MPSIKRLRNVLDLMLLYSTNSNLGKKPILVEAVRDLLK
jgi:hypothetical protein